MQRFLIRPHHMLCLQFFEGKGYSDEFVTNMADIKDILDKQNPYVEIVSGVDDICMKCPNYIEGNCKNEKNVLEHDKRVYEQIHDIHKLSNWSEICKSVDNEIILKGKVKAVCGQCRWSDICFHKAMQR